MASLKVFSVGKLVKYVTGSPFKTVGVNLSRSASARSYSTEEKTKSPEEAEKKPTTLDDCHKLIETLTTDITKFKEQLKEYEDKYKRALADGENVRRRMMKQVEDAKSYAVQGFCKDLLDVADTLSAAAESVPAGAGTEGSAALRALHDGVVLTKAQLTQVFSRHGLQAVSPLREKFDPNLHEALFQQEVEGAEAGTVVAVSKVGYKLHDRCVRPALVGVAK